MTVVSLGAHGCRTSLRAPLFVVDFSNGSAGLSSPLSLIPRAAEAAGVPSAISSTSSTYATATRESVTPSASRPPTAVTLGCRISQRRTPFVVDLYNGLEDAALDWPYGCGVVGTSAILVGGFQRPRLMRQPHARAQALLRQRVGRMLLGEAVLLRVRESPSRRTHRRSATRLRFISRIRLPRRDR
jgi:hypothetical protein